MLSDKEKHILNLSDYTLSDAEKFVLSNGLDFCLPPKNVNREEVFAEFEILYAQLARQQPISSNELNSLKARLSDLAHAYCGTPVDLGDFNMHKEHFHAIKSLRSNEQILITKPDKGSGVVILNRSDYIQKMGNILEDKTKFLNMGSVNLHDNTAKNEQKLQKRLLDLVNQNILARDVYDRIRPTGSQRPRMYGLPKTHKEDTPFRPILSMIGSSQHELAKWLAEILAPVLKSYSSHCIKDSFTFANFIQNCNLEPTKAFLCSFDISSLFTNVPLDETIGICADAFYRGHLDCPPFPEDTFKELMLIATRGVEFSFNNQMYKQLDGVAMGSPLGPALANIFVGFHESRLFDNTVKPGVYFRYVDDTFVIFSSELDCDCFHGKLNLLHPALNFTVEKEQNNSLSFLDVLVEKEGTGFLTSVYRKPTFTGQYIRWNSFSPKSRKISLIKTLVHRALMICSKTKLGSELDRVKQLLIENGYPDDVLISCIKQKLANFAAEKPCGPEKCPVYLKLPWIGNVSSRFENQINKAITSCFYAVKPRVVYNTKVMLPSAKKDSVPTTQKSCVVYEFSCRCEARYVGRTTQRLADRIKQHIPTSIRKKNTTIREQPPRMCKNSNSKMKSDSAIGQHLIKNPECAKTYSDDNFRIIGQARSSFHLSVLESVYIKTQNPVLCKQKEFIVSLGLF